MLKHYRFRDQSGADHPSLLWEIRLDIQDVRSGYRGSDLGVFRGPFIDEADIDWSEDLVKRLELSSLQEIDAPEMVTWPTGADEKLIRHLLQHHRIPLWRNYRLGIYSGLQESREEFFMRCLASLREERISEHQKVQDIFLRRFLEIEHLLLERIQEEDSEPELQERMTSRVRDLFSDFREDFSRCFLEEGLTPLNESDLDWTGRIDVEFQERILKLRSDLVNRYNEINEAAKKKAASIEKYEATLSYPQIEIVSRGVLWPKQR